jgi:hypothetical protein
MSYEFWKLSLGVVATVGLYSVLYRENKFYRFWEHVFLGLAGGWAVVTIWSETLYDKWWLKMTGKVASGESPATPGYWPWVFLGVFGLMGYFVFSKKHNWISRIPIGIILGLWSGQQVEIWWRTYGPQIKESMKPVIPTDFTPVFVPDTTGMSPEAAAAIGTNLYPSEALTNLVFVFTMLAVLSYFLFSFEIKGGIMKGMTTSGRWLLMVGFGAIFGNTVMMRFSLLIDRMYFVWIEWFRDTVVPMLGGGGGPAP